MQAEKPTLRGYAAAIAEATGAPAHALAIVEEIMRNEIFHSTLDWQSAEEFTAGAVEAYSRYLANQDAYDAEARWQRAHFRVTRAEQALERLRKDPDSGDKLAAAQAELEAARFEEAAARASIPGLTLT